MLELVITFPDDKTRNLGPLLNAAPDFFADLVGIAWREVPGDPKPLTRVRVDRSRGSKFHHPEMTTPQCIMKHFTPMGMFTKSVARRWLVKFGFAENSVESAVSLLCSHGHIKQIPGGKYQFVKEMDLSRKIALKKTEKE